MFITPLDFFNFNKIVLFLGNFLYQFFRKLLVDVNSVFHSQGLIHLVQLNLSISICYSSFTGKISGRNVSAFAV